MAVTFSAETLGAKGEKKEKIDHILEKKSLHNHMINVLIPVTKEITYV